MAHCVVDTEIYVYERMWHVFEDSTLPEAAARQEIATFLFNHLGEESAHL